MRRRGVWDADRVQAALNVLGGAAFVAGSVLFLLPPGFAPGVALFILGSLAMFVGSVLAWRARYGPPRRAGAGAPGDTLEPATPALEAFADAPTVGAWPLVSGEAQPAAPAEPSTPPPRAPAPARPRRDFRAPVRMPWMRALRRR